MSEYKQTKGIQELDKCLLERGETTLDVWISQTNLKERVRKMSKGHLFTGKPGVQVIEPSEREKKEGLDALNKIQAMRDLYKVNRRVALEFLEAAREAKKAGGIVEVSGELGHHEISLEELEEAIRKHKKKNE